MNLGSRSGEFTRALRMATVKFSADLPSDVAEKFDTFCKKKGYVKWRALVAALRLLEYAPAELREALMEGDQEAVRRWFEQSKKRRRT